MTPLLTLIAWIGAGVRRWLGAGDRLAQQQDHSLPAARGDEPEVAQSEELSTEVAQSEELSTQVAQSEELSTQVAQSEELVAQREKLRVTIEQSITPARDGPPPDTARDGADDDGYRAAPRRVDTASWEFVAIGEEWPQWRELRRAARQDRRSVEWVDKNGTAIELALDRGRPGSGVIVLATGATRIALKRSRAEVQITQIASEIEGVNSWGLRWLPRIARWLLGAEIDPADCVELGDQLHELGVVQRRIETCVDVIRWQIRPGDERGLISKAYKWARWHDEDGSDGFGAGERSKSPDSIAVYDKIAKLMSERGPMRTALLARLGAHGWRPGDPVARIEARKQGAGLQLEDLDATHPGAAFDSEIVDRLFVDSLSRHRLVSMNSTAKRNRDRPEHRAWELARAAGGSIEPVKLRRSRAKRQLAATRHNYLRRFGRMGADVDILVGGDGSGARALDALENLICGREWADDRARARAKFGELLEQASEEQAEEGAAQ